MSPCYSSIILNSTLPHSTSRAPTWYGDHLFLVRKLVLKDFKIRYRNMSLGVLWSLANPLLMMTVLTFVFTKIFKSPEQHYPVFLFCGLLPFNFFSFAWSSGTGSILDNAGLIKRVPVPREIVPISTVISCCLHLFIQIGLLLVLVLVFGLGVNIYWLWIPVVLGLEVVFVTGLSLLTSGLNVIIRDTRYAVDSINVLLFWLVPIIYPLTLVPIEFREIYQINPLAALAVSLRNILIEGTSPAFSLIGKMSLVSVGTLALGLFTFGRLKSRFYNYL